MKNMNCLCCGSEDVIRGVSVKDRTRNGERDLTLETYDDPDAFIFKGAHRAVVNARVCCACGYVMMFAAVSGVERLKAGEVD